MASKDQRSGSVGSVSSSRSSSYDLSSASSAQSSKKARGVDPDQSAAISERASIAVPGQQPRRAFESSAAAARRPSTGSEALRSIQAAAATRHSHRESLGSLLGGDEEHPRRPPSAHSYLRRSSITSTTLPEEAHEPETARASFSSSLRSLGTAILNGFGTIPSTTSSVAGSDVGDCKRKVSTPHEFDLLMILHS